MKRSSAEVAAPKLSCKVPSGLMHSVVPACLPAWPACVCREDQSGTYFPHLAWPPLLFPALASVALMWLPSLNRSRASSNSTRGRSHHDQLHSMAAWVVQSVSGSPIGTITTKGAVRMNKVEQSTWEGGRQLGPAHGWRHNIVCASNRIPGAEGGVHTAMRLTSCNPVEKTVSSQVRHGGREKMASRGEPKPARMSSGGGRGRSGERDGEG